MSTVILGLPGMYQNWLSAALDPDSRFEQQGANFLTFHSAVPWQAKIETTAVPDADCIINMCVGYHNLVWYLHNYLEKTDDIHIRTDCLVEDLQSHGGDTKAFGPMLDHWYQSYNIQTNPNPEYQKNSLIEYFYYWLVQKHHWQQMLCARSSNHVNLEYAAFNSLGRLRSVLAGVIPDQSWFDQMYQRLRFANSQYMDQSEKFCTKLGLIDNINRLTILEQSYIGSLVHSCIDMGDTVLDWYNPDVRQRLWRRYHATLVDMHRYHMLQSQYL